MDDADRSFRGSLTTQVDRRKARSLALLAAIGLAFMILRIPLAYRQAGGQDEDYYAVPGWTILQGGIPRIPYVPSRHHQSVFYRADEALFALPPAYFYWQAAVYLVTGPSYGAGRLSSALAGLAAIGLVYSLGRRFYRDERAALWGAGLYSLSRLFYFPATCARPDMLCATFSLAALLAASTWRSRGFAVWILLAGNLAGLALLTHPFAIVLCVQLGAWTLISGEGWRDKLLATGVLIAGAIVTFSLWLPLIAAYPEHFNVQFLNNVWNRSGPGLLSRIAFPTDSWIAQGRLLWENAGPLQLALLAFGLLVATSREIRERDPDRITALALAWSSAYLLVVFQGSHPAKGYWCYPAALLFLAVGRSLTISRETILGRRPMAGGRLIVVGGVAVVLIMAPGLGLRTFVAHLRHWNDPAYNHPALVEQVFDDLPAKANYLVDVSSVFDFYIAGRDPALALNIRPYFEAEGRPYDYLVVGRTGLRQALPEQLDAQPIQTYGNANDLFADYLVVFRPASDPPNE